MNPLFRIIGVIILTVLICYLIKKLTESIINFFIYRETMKHPERYPDRINRGGMVLNKKNKKLEADNNILLPF